MESLDPIIIKSSDEKQDNRGLHIPRPDFGPRHTGSSTWPYGKLFLFFLYKLFKMYFFCEIEEVSRCLKCNVLLLKRKTKSPKTTKRKHVIILVTIDGLPEKFKLKLHGGKIISTVK